MNEPRVLVLTAAQYALVLGVLEAAVADNDPRFEDNEALAATAAVVRDCALVGGNVNEPKA